VRMVTRLARGMRADREEQVGHARVTRLAPVGGHLGPYGVGGAGHGGLRRGQRRQTLGPHGLLLVVIHQGERGAPPGARAGNRAERGGPGGPRGSGLVQAHRARGDTRQDRASMRESPAQDPPGVG